MVSPNAGTSVDSLARLERLCSPQVGIVRRKWEVMKDPHGARLIQIGCHVHTLSPTDRNNVFVGHGRTREEATAAALGEAAERFSGREPAPGKTLLASALDLEPNVVNPECFALFSDAQYRLKNFPYVRFTPTTRVRWVLGYSLVTGEPVYLPAQLVYMSSADDEERIGYTTTNGMACGGSAPDAILAGLLERVERDALMLTWYHRLSHPRVTWRHISEVAALDDAFFAPTGLDYDVVDMSAFLGIPTFLAIVHPGRFTGAFGIGTASATNPIDAWWKSLREAFTTNTWLRRELLHDPAAIAVRRRSDIETFDQHFFYYANRSRQPRMRFLTNGAGQRPLERVPTIEPGSVLDQVEAVVSRLTAAQVDVYAVDITAPEIADAGLHVVKVVAPQLCDLDVFYSARFLGGPRLLTAAFDAGLTNSPAAYRELNPDPHPMV